MSELSLDAVFAACPSGEVTGAWRAFLEKGNSVSGAVTIRPGQALAIWVGDLLRREAPKHADGVSMWVTDASIAEGAWSQAAYSKDGPPPVISITDGTLVGVPGSSGPFDLSTGKFAVTGAGKDYFRVEVFNLRTLYQLCCERAQAWISKQQKSGVQTTPSLPVS